MHFMKEKIAARLKAARKDAKYASVGEAAAALGIRYPTYAAHENGSRAFDNAAAALYARRFRVSLDWLLTGKGSPYSGVVSTYDPDKPDEEDIDDRTDETPPPMDGGDIANLAIRGGLGLGSPEGVETSDSGQIYADHVSGFWSFPPAVKAGWRNMPHVYSIPVEGDSMEPTLTSGSYVFVDMTHNVPTPEDIYACDYGDGLTIKRLQLIPRSDKIRVMSDNQRYSSYELLREEVRVYGRVVAWFQWRG